MPRSSACSLESSTAGRRRGSRRARAWAPPAGAARRRACVQHRQELYLTDVAQGPTGRKELERCPEANGRGQTTDVLQRHAPTQPALDTRYLALGPPQAYADRRHRQSSSVTSQPDLTTSFHSKPRGGSVGICENIAAGWHAGMMAAHSLPARYPPLSSGVAHGDTKAERTPAPTARVAWRATEDVGAAAHSELVASGATGRRVQPGSAS
jgi:hypothetical protein